MKNIISRNRRPECVAIEGQVGKQTLVALLLGLMILFGTARQARAQSGIDVTDVRVEYRFGEQINFLARIQAPLPVQSATVTFREPDGLVQTRPLTVNPDGTAGYRYDASLHALAPFTPIVFWFNVMLTDGTAIESGTYNFNYADNRFPWQVREEGMLRVHWYNGDPAFGDAVLNMGQRGLQSVTNLIPVDVTAPIDIWVYSDSADLQGALVLGGQSWVAGHASPEIGVAMVSVKPGLEQSIELERQVPHELAHILLFRRIGADYARLPAWLTEGMATMAELYPNPDYASSLKIAADTNSLLPLTDLCASFPPDTANAFLAYAESESFTRYIVDNYGTTGLSALASAYADGLDCEQGARQALNLSLSQLEVRWRESTLGENRSGVIAYNLFPYLILLGLVLLVPVWGAFGRIRERMKNARAKD